MSFSPRGCAHPVLGRARLLASVGAACARSRGPDGRYDPHGTRSSMSSACTMHVRSRFKTDAFAPPAPGRAAPPSRTRRTRRPRGSIDRSATVARVRAYAVASKNYGSNHETIPKTLRNINIKTVINAAEISYYIAQFSSEPGPVQLGLGHRFLIDFAENPINVARRRTRRRGSQQRVWAVSRPRRRTVPRTGRGS